MGPHCSDLLQRLHNELFPASYLEIGVEGGASLSLARSRGIGIDPDPRVSCYLHPEIRIFPQDSDAFFASNNVLGLLGGRRVDLAFIDGMHLFEYVLRDFINIERLCHDASIVCVSNVLPQTVRMASRAQQPDGWTGDVYKLVLCLREHRPDLFLAVLNILPAGVLLIGNLQCDNRILSERYAAILERYVPMEYEQIHDARDDRLGVLDGDHIATDLLISRSKMKREEKLQMALRKLMLREARVQNALCEPAPVGVPPRVDEMAL